MTHRVATALLALVLVACRGSAPGTQPTTAAGTAAGDTTAFGARILRVVGGPARATYELDRPAYVTLLSVDFRSIVAIAPVTGMKSELLGRGQHTAGLSQQTEAGDFSVGARFGPRAGLTEDPASAAAVGEYNRCVANARRAAAQRRTGPRPVIGRDSTGQPIYGPPTESADDARRSDEHRCKMPTIGIQHAADQSAPAKPGRYLLLFASDTPVAYRDVTELVITAADVRTTAQIIGDKLFGVRGARWSVSSLPW